MPAGGRAGPRLAFIYINKFAVPDDGRADPPNL